LKRPYSFRHFLSLFLFLFPQFFAVRLFAGGVTMAPLAPVCDSYTGILLTGGSPGGGIYTGTGVQNGYFYPYLTGGAGTYWIYYTVYVGGLPETDSTTITVNPLPTYPTNPTSSTLPFVGTGPYNESNCPNGTLQYTTPGCVGTTENYTIPAVAGTTYSWKISNEYGPSYAQGGTIVGANNSNSVNISWTGAPLLSFYGGGQGYYTLFQVTEVNSFGCADSFYLFFQINAAPVAAFTATTACLGTATQFTDGSTDAVQWFWNFGDGGTSNVENPAHTFTTAGPHTVKLVVRSGCYCADSITETVNVLSTPAPAISCPSTFCPGSNSNYSSNPGCGNYTWVVTGGTIVSGQGTDNISVDWSTGGPQGTVSLQTTGCTPAQCPLPTVTTVPLIPAAATITGKTVVCASESDNYTIPSFPGTNITWSVVPASAGTILTGQGTSNVQVQWGAAGSAVLQVNISHDILSCSSNATLNVLILPYFYLTESDYEVCLGGSNTFSTNPNGNVNWTVPDGTGTVTSGQGTGSATISWSRSGSHYVVAKPTGPGTYCNDSSYAYVYVDSIPPPPVTGPLYICPGSEQEYTANGPTYYTSYSFSATNGTVSSVSGNNVWITWGASGPYSISVVENDGYDPYCSSAPETIAVYDITKTSPPISGADSACVNGTYFYSVPYLYGASYGWSVSPPQNGSIIYGQGSSSIGIQYTTSGPLTITCNTYFCTNPIVSTFNVYVNPSPVPAISSAGYICPSNGSVTLSTVPGEKAYNWTLGGATVGTGTTDVVTAAGYYVLYVTAPDGCVGKQKIDVPMQQAPLSVISSPDPYFYCTGLDGAVNTALSALQSSSSGTYQWYREGVAIGTNSPSYTATDTGTYYLVVTNSFGCITTSNLFPITAGPCGPGGGGGGGPPATGSGGSTSTAAGAGAGAGASDDITFKRSGQEGLKTGNDKGGEEAILNNLGSGAGADPTPQALQIICTRDILFSNTSPSPTNAWWWDFGDFTTPSTLEDPTHLYTYPGFYYVEFWAQFTGGAGSMMQYLPIEIPYKAKFTYTTGCMSAQFSDESMFALGYPITSWSWSFGDGGTSTLENPSHTYAAPGTYTVTLTIAGGVCSRYTTQTVVIPPKPQAAFSAPAACLTFPTTFTDSSTGTGLYTWLWNFGDGYISNNESTVHTYGAAGTYTVTLIVTDITGCSDTIMHPVVVSSPTGAGSITANGPTTFCQGSDVLLTASAAATYQWSTGANTQYILVDEPGQYSCTVTYATGCITQIPQVTVNVNGTPYGGVYATETNQICAGTTDYLYASYSTDYSYQWYDNGAAVSGANTYNFTTTTTGTYYCVVTDLSTGCSTTSTNLNLNNMPPSPIAPSITGPSSVCQGAMAVLNAMASGGTGTLSYYWSNGVPGQTDAVNYTGTFYLTVTDANGCTSSNYYSVTVNPLPDLYGFPVGCYQMCYKDTLQVEGAGISSFQWLFNGVPIPPPAGTQQNMIVKKSGTYSLIGISSAGCIDTSGNVDITTKPLPQDSVGPNATICQTGGEVDSLWAFTNAPTYSWTPAAGLSSATVLNPVAAPVSTTSYVLYTLGANGCKNYDTVTVTVSCTNPQVSVKGASVCTGGCATLTGTNPGGGTAPYTYSWSSGQTGIGPISVCPLLTATFSVTITDHEGNTGVDSAIVTVTSGVTALKTLVTPTKCVGTVNGSFLVTPSGAATPFTYSWSAGITGGTTSGSGYTVSGLAAGNYSVTVTDANGCSKDTVLTMISPQPVVPAVTTSPSLCGKNTGSVTASATGGTGAYTYYWGTGISGSTTQQTGLTSKDSTLVAGSYTVTVSDVNGCTATSSALVTNTGGAILSAGTIADVTCNGGNNGTALVNAAGGTPNYTYSWSNGSSSVTSALSSSAAGLSAIAYTVTITDANLCISVTTVTLTQPGIIVPVVKGTSSTCNQSNGSIAVSASGGTGLFTYSWSSGASSVTGYAAGSVYQLSGLSASTYTVTITDGNGCVHDTVYQLDNSSGPKVALGAPVNPLCFGSLTGSASVSASGGNGALAYSWSTGLSGVTAASGFTSQLTGLGAGSYTVTVSDASGCTLVNTITITQPAVLSVTATTEPILCNGICSGQAAVIPAGGTGAYTMNWSNSGVGLSQQKLCAGMYSVTITDVNKCTKDTSFTLNQPPALGLALQNVVSDLCFGNCLGSADVIATGGTAPYVFAWSNAATGQTASNLCEGTYSVTVTDNNSCGLSTVAKITQPAQLVVPAIGPLSVCIGQTSTLSVNPTGGTPAYAYVWAPGGQTGSSITVNETATSVYTVTVTDANDCPSVIQAITLNLDSSLTATTVSVQPVCPGTNVKITAVGSGGDDRYSYTWLTHPEQFTSSITVLVKANGMDTLIVNDGCGSPADTVLVPLTVSPVPQVNFSASDTAGCPVLCSDFTDMSTMAGGTLTNWMWTFGNGTTSTRQNPSNVCFDKSGRYTIIVKVTGDDNCSASDTVQRMIDVYPLPHAAFTTNPVIVTVVNPVVNFVDQSTGASSWLWDFGDVSGNANSSTLENPVHTYSDIIETYCILLTVENAQGCIDTVSHCLLIGPDFEFYVPNAFTPNGDGRNDSFNGNGIGVAQYDMQIFDRWGLMIFETTSLSNGWNGCYGASKAVCQQDVYVYKIALTDVFSQQHSYVGTVTLLR